MAHNILVGIPVRERIDLVERSLSMLKRNTANVSVVLLADGLDAHSMKKLQGYQIDALLATDRALGDAACFNRLVMHRHADLYVLLENGALVAPHWLERIEQSLAQNPAYGLAGPSTNRSWNEQQQFTRLAPEELDLVSREAFARFGDTCTSLAPLHSLGDFCFAVTRAVVDRIGAADEGYADGPCWEMDYSARALRAGFLGVWAKSALVWRAPQTLRRKLAEERRFELNKRRYQNQFCALHLTRQTTRYDAHCVGEVCEHFAPKELIVTRREFRALTRALPVVAATVPSAAPLRNERPLASCIMPTADRRSHVPQAIQAFLMQDYEPRELIILDDGSDSVADLIPDDPRIRYVRSTTPRTLGNKRNEACLLARGEIIIHWDDDDWHARFRLRYQINELLAHRADICGLDRIWFYDEENRRAWQYRYPGGRARWLAGGSFCYRRALWERQRFSDVTVGEDTRFVRSAAFAKIVALERDDFYVARVHAQNTCRKQTNGGSWFPVDGSMVENIIARGCLTRDREELPLVSCIMPTYNRPLFVALALRRFAEQRYPNKELIIVDDGADSVEHMVSAAPNCRYLRLGTRRSIGEKRNAACELARGEIIVQWDDDDWYGPERLTRQTAPIIANHADVTGLRCKWWMTLPEAAFWQVSPALHRRMFVHDLHGGTLVFRKQLWSGGAKYPPANLAEDAAFLRAVLKRGARVEVLANEGDFIYSRHGANAWRFATGHFLDPRQWQPISRPDCLDEETVASYRQAHLVLHAAHESIRTTA